MKTLKSLLDKLKYEVLQGNIDIPIQALIYESNKVTDGCLFVCIKGARFDGHDFAAEAAERGASALIVEHEVELSSSNAAVIKVSDSREALALLSAAWFDYPARSLKTIGITGTKGKTTTTYLVKSILERAHHKVGLIGTIEAIVGDEHFEAKNTTPESYVIQEYFAKMRDIGIDSVVMEVSSQALMLHRVGGFTFDFGVFTNIEPDHIGAGEHKDFDDYIDCKSRLFKNCRVGIVNADDEHLERILKGHSCEVQSFGLGKAANIRAFDMSLVKTPGELGVKFHIKGRGLDGEMEIGTPGRFSVQNALCAAAICVNFGVSEDDIRLSLKNPNVKGRIEAVKISDRFSLLIDYAHNAMALESLLSSLREYEPQRLVCLFGCGGNRSRDRRFEMGEVSGRLADFTIITSDNPRFEKPEAIMDDIETGIKRTDGSYIRIADRKEAIAYAIDNARDGDLIILAGKGHEDYQEIEGVKHPMDERVLIREILDERRSKDLC